MSQRKVRLACRRCRARRIKCDGQVPACSNCAKAGETCLDVDAQNSNIIIPRNFANAARYRIQWLENIIRARLPDVDLDAGPQIDAPSVNPSLVAQGAPSIETAENSTVVATPSTSHGTVVSPEAQSGALKRPIDVVSPRDHQDEPMSARAHSVAVDLGRLTLNSDSTQRHYLGSSSGLLFASLIGASPSRTYSAPSSDVQPDDQLSRDIPGEHYRSMFILLKRTLPEQQDARVLAQTYIRSMHPEYPVLEPSCLLAAIDALYYCASCPATDPILEGGWPDSLEGFQWNGRQIPNRHDQNSNAPVSVVAFIIFMVFNISALIQVRSRVYEYSPSKYYRAAIHFSADCFAQVTLSSIQAVAMLAIHSSYTPAEANLWTLIHIGLAHCVELGIHREYTPESPEEERTQRLKRLIFYTIYSLDRTVSSIQGRPLGLRDESFDVAMPQADESPFGDKDSDFTRTVELFSLHRFELDSVISEIKTRLYLLPARSPQATIPADPTRDQKTIHDSLQSWWDRVLTRRNYLPTIWNIKLKIKFHTTMILLHQPSQTIRNPSQPSLQAVFDNASGVLQNYQILHDNHSLHYGWKGVQNIFAAGAAFIYSFWTAADVEHNADAKSLTRDLRTCLSLLSVGGEWWPSAKKSLANLGCIIDLTVQRLYTRGTRSKQRRLTKQGPDHAAGFEQFGASQNLGDPANANWNMYGYPPANETGVQNQDIPGNWAAMDPTEQANEVWGSPDNAPAGYADMGQEIAPEIVDFLAEFDKSDLTWSFPLEGDEGRDGSLRLSPVAPWQ
ncbi:hypothetical protein F5Y08DRAFT_168382 [Xylaria arbuscula]|nr:hypothetical protein F5Y08DRAFT_168382 [Xylaria arbuscula]